MYTLFRKHEANKQFLSIYCGNQRNDSKAWIGYFSSSDFLQVAAEPEFMALLLQEVQEQQNQYPPSQKFLNWLSIAYQIKRNNNAELIKEICDLGMIPKTYTNLELMLSDSFAEYWQLVQIAKTNHWTEDSIYKYSKIIEKYQLIFIKEKRNNVISGEISRHPIGVHLLIYFFEKYPLPEELYQILWDTLDLKSAKYGRAQIVYGKMRQIVLEHIPTIQEQPQKQLGAFKSDFLYCCAGCYKRAGSNPQKDKEEIEAFCERQEFEQALKNRQFVSENFVDGIWVEQGTPSLFLEKFLDFYTQHPDAPYAEKVIKKVKDSLKAQRIMKQKNKEKQAEETKPIPKGILPLSNRSFFDYWFHICCNTMCVPRFCYQYSDFQYNQTWIYKFLTTENDCLDNGKTPYKKIQYSLQDGEERAEVEIRFHLYYIDFIINGEPTYRPVFDWDWLATLEETDMFFHLLLMTVTLYNQYDIVEQEIIRRLYLLDLPLSKNEMNTIAGIFAKYICSLSMTNDSNITEHLEDENDEEYSQADKNNSFQPVDPVQLLSQLSYVIFTEDSSKLYGAICAPSINWIKVFEQPLNENPEFLFSQKCLVNNEDKLKRFAIDMLQEKVAISEYPLEKLVHLPIAVYLTPDKSEANQINIPKVLTGQQITLEHLREALNLFAEKKINRLEFSWETQLPFTVKQEYQARRSLVFLREDEKYVCLLFDDASVECYGLPVNPSQDKLMEEDFEFVPFLKEKLFSKHIHKSFHTIQIQLERVFQSIFFPNGYHLWSQAINVSHGRNKYNMDKQLLGNFPVEWAHNNISDKIYLDIYPDSFALTNLQETSETIILKTSNRFKIQTAFQQYLKGQAQQLCLNWSYLNLVLLQENGQYMMVFLHRDNAEFCVADKQSYFKSNNEDAAKELFLGKITPSYLLHKDIAAFRNHLELLLAKITEPECILNEFAQYTNTNLPKEWSFQTLCEEFLGKENV